jgi:sugar/nucleoside kinase (ribokinase family)
MRTPLIVIGNVNVDLVMGPQAPWPKPGTEVLLPTSDLRVGGAAGNTALALQALDVPFTVIANTSADALGRWLREPFGRHATAWPAAEEPCALSVGITHPDGERTFFTSLGHLHAFDVAAVMRQLPSSTEAGATALLTGAFVCPALLPHYEQLCRLLQERGFSVALDTGWPDSGWSDGTRRTVRSWLLHCRHLLINEVEALGLTGKSNVHDAAGDLLHDLPAGAALVIKMGAEGAVAWCGSDHIRTPAPTVAVIDTIGAGDSFNAGYLAAQAAGRPLAHAIAAGVNVASTAISTRPRRYCRVSHE